MKTVPRGFGYVFYPRYRNKRTGEVKRQCIAWVQYCRNGKVIRESSHSTKENVAWKLLQQRHAAIAAGLPTGPSVTRTMFEDLTVMLVNDYRANERRSLNRVEDAINHLREFFGNYRAIAITNDGITAYKSFRLDQKAANSTINNELSGLGKMFTLAIDAGKAGVKPKISKLRTKTHGRVSSNEISLTRFSSTSRKI
jgi:hypothetical protein